MFSGSKDRLPREWAQRFSTGASLTEYGKNNKIELKGYLIDGARVNNARLTNFSFNEIDFNDFGGEDIELANGVFKDCSFNDATFDRAKLENIVFENCKLFDTTFVSATLKKINFINCDISNTALFNLKDSDIKFINTNIHDNDYKLSDSKIQMHLVNSELKNTDMRKLKEGSSIYMENSEIDTVNFQYSKLDFFKSVNSKMLNSTLGDSEINELSFDKSTIDISFGDAKISSVIVNNSTIKNIGAIWTTITDFVITNCDGQANVSFAESNIDNIAIKNCNFSKIAPSELLTKSLKIENAVIEKSSFYKSNIEDFTLRSVTFNGKTKFKKFNAQKATLDNVKIGPDAEMLMDGANIEF